MFEITSLIRRLNSVPTAPFRELWVASVLDEILTEIPNISFETDRFGNRLVRLKKGRPVGDPVTFVAHLDHPGFLFSERDFPNGQKPLSIHGLFEGRVLDIFFKDAPIKVFSRPDDPGTPATITDFSTERREHDNRTVTVSVERSVTKPLTGMWDVPIYEEDGDIIHSRVCDDLAGCASILSAFRELSKLNHIDVAAIFSRGEEAGFCGVLCLLNEKKLHPLLPKSTIFISVETSSEFPGVELGSGAIIRTGDRSSTFDGPITDSLWSCARDEGIKATRRLMDRGTCEATAFTRSGYRSGGVCIPLRNYHNMDLASGKAAPEAISLSDAEGLRSLIVALARKSSSDAPQAPIITSNDFDAYLSKGYRELEPEPAEEVSVD